MTPDTISSEQYISIWVTEKHMDNITIHLDTDNICTVTTIENKKSYNYQIDDKKKIIVFQDDVNTYEYSLDFYIYHDTLYMTCNDTSDPIGINGIYHIQ